MWVEMKKAHPCEWENVRWELFRDGLWIFAYQMLKLDTWYDAREEKLKEEIEKSIGTYWEKIIRHIKTKISEKKELK